MADELSELLAQYDLNEADQHEIDVQIAAQRLISGMARARAEAGLTQAQIAERMRTSQGTVARLEAHRHDPRLSTIARYIAACGIPPELIAQLVRDAAAGDQGMSGPLRYWDPDLEWPTEATPPEIVPTDSVDLVSFRLFFKDRVSFDERGNVFARIYGYEPSPVLVPLKSADWNRILTRSVAELEVHQQALTAVAKNVLVDHVHRSVKGVDLLWAKPGQKVSVEVPMSVVGKPVRGWTVHRLTETVMVTAPPNALPETVTISVEGAQPGALLLASQSVPLPEVSLDAPDAVVASVVESSQADADR